MAESAMHDIPSAYEPSLFGTYSKKIGIGCSCSPIR